MYLMGRTFSDRLVSSFYRFLARFSGRRRGVDMREGAMRLSLLPLISILALHTFGSLVEGCSSRSTPKPRPPVLPVARPNPNFHTTTCPPSYADSFCLNGATCFTVDIGEFQTYYCECADGFMGMRCEFKDLDGSYTPSRHRVMLETASIASGATIAVFLVVCICIYVYVRIQRKHKHNLITSHCESSGDLGKQTPFGREIPRIALHHVSRERGTGDNISLGVYDFQGHREPT